MPRSGQIIPKWLHPHEETYINDYTRFEDVAIDQSGVRFLNVFLSDKGIDNKILTKKSLVAWVNEYGLPNYRFHGQSPYMPYASLATQNAISQSMRVMPANADYANVIVTASIKADKTVPASPKLNVKFKVLTRSGLQDKSLFNTYMETLVNETPDTDGYITYPILGVYALGRGKYGNAFRVRMANDSGANKSNDYKNYVFEVLSTENGLEKKESFTASVYEEATDPQTYLTLFFNEVVNDFAGNGSKLISATVMSDYLEKIFEFYKAQVDPETTFTAENFDIFGYDVLADATNTKIVIDGGAASVGLTALEGIGLASGTDGDFDITTAKATRDAAIDAAFLAAFNGGTDPVIKSKLRCPVDIMLDANYSIQNKKALASLAIARMDSVCHLDSGLLTTVNDILTFSTQLGDIANYVISKECGMMNIKDPITNKSIPVTVSLWLASKYPYHYINYGNHQPMAGEEFATVSGYEKNTIKPHIDMDDDEIKESLYLKRINYIECIAENTFMRGSQSTSQNYWSDLSETNNVLVLLEIKRILERLSASKRYRFSETEDRRRFTEDAQEVLSSYKGTKVRSINVYFDQNKWETIRSILHCYCSIVYKNIAKRNIIEIDINPRA